MIDSSEQLALAADWPPVVERDDGSLVVLSGLWGTAKRTYAYATLEIAGTKPGAVGPTIAKPLFALKGSEIAEFLGLDAAWSGKDDRATIWWIAAATPTRVKAGETYTSTGHIHYGDAHVFFYGGPTSGPGYRSQSKKFAADHAAEMVAPQPPTPSQAETLQKFLDRAQAWGIGGLQMPATKAAAKQILDALAENGWKLRLQRIGGTDPMMVWRQAIRARSSPHVIGNGSGDPLITPKAALGMAYRPILGRKLINVTFRMTNNRSC